MSSAAARVRATLSAAPAAAVPSKSRANSPAWGQDGPGIAIRQMGGEKARLPGEARQRVGIENEAAPGRRRHGDAFPGGLAGPESRTGQNHIQPLVGEQVVEVIGTLARPQHDRREMRGVLSERRGRRRDGHEPGADPQGTAGGQPGGPGLRGRPGQHEGVAAGVFVAQSAEPREGSGPQVGPVPMERRADGQTDRERLRSGPDIREAELPAEAASGLEQVSGLERHEGHGLHRPDRDTSHRTGIAVDPGRHVDREHRDPGGVHRLDERAGGAVEIARQTGPEQGVDHEVAGRQRAAVDLTHRSRPGLGGQGGVPF